MKQQMVDMKAAAEVAAAAAADAAQTVIQTEVLDKMNEAAATKDTAIEELRQQIQELKVEFEKSQESLKKSEDRYNQLLRSQAIQAGQNVSMAAPAPTAAGGRASLGGAGARGAARGASNRNVDIQLAGMQGTGKTTLLEKLISDNDKAQLTRFAEQKSNLMSHHQIQMGERLLKLLDCSGNTRAQHLVKEWFGRSHWVVVVYDMADSKTLDHAIELVKEVAAAGARVILFGNKHNVNNGEPMQVDIMSAKDCAASNQGMAIEGTSLADAVKICLQSIDEAPAEIPEGLHPDLMAGLEGGGRRADGGRSSISVAIDSVKSWFGTQQRGGANSGVLRPSLKGTKSMKQGRREGDVNADLRPVQELQDSESAVTCISFGQERLHKAYVLLATASKDGTVVIYRCYRTEMETQMLSDQDFPQDDAETTFSAPPADHSNIAVHSRLVGHSRAITSIFFNLLEDQLVTTSIDKSVRFWGVDTGEMLKVFTDSSPVPVAAFLPFNPQVFVAANSNAVLRLVNVQNGMVLQKLKVETEVRALKFDDTGLFLLAGTKNGSIHVLEASDSNTLKFKFKVQLARGGVTCITFVPAAYGQPSCLLVNTSDSSATIIDCTYGPPAGVLTNLSVRHRVRVAHSLLPLKSCYSPSGEGYLISGSEDKEVYIYSLSKGSNYKMQYLKHHQVPVVAVAVNFQDTLLASADSLGRIVLWRRMDFSHLAD